MSQEEDEDEEKDTQRCLLCTQHAPHPEFAVLCVRAPEQEPDTLQGNGEVSALFEHAKPLWSASQCPVHELQRKNRRRKRQYLHLLRIGPFATPRASSVFMRAIRKQHFPKKHKLTLHVRAAMDLVEGWNQHVPRSFPPPPLSLFVEDQFFAWARELPPNTRLPRHTLLEHARMLLLHRSSRSRSHR